MTTATENATVLISHNTNNHTEKRCKFSRTTRVKICNNWISSLLRWLGFDVFVTPVSIGDPVYWMMWDSVPKQYFVSEAVYVTEVGKRGFRIAFPEEDPDEYDDFYLYSEIGQYIFLSEQDAEEWIEKNGHIPPELPF